LHLWTLQVAVHIHSPVQHSDDDDTFMVAFVEFIHESIVVIVCKTALFTFSQQLAKMLASSFGILQQAKTRSDNFTGRSVSTALKLLSNELIKVSPDGKYWCSWPCAPPVTKYWYQIVVLKIPSINHTSKKS